MAVMHTALAKFAPRLSDSAGALQMARQQRDEPPHSRSGALYEAGGRGRLRGRGNQNPAGWIAAWRSNLRRSAAGRTAS